MTNLPQSVRRRLEAQAAGEHPDAGMLTAFTEQALNAPEREKVLLHLASCAACREVVALAAPETAAAKEVTPLAPSWFRPSFVRWAAVAATAVIVWAAVSVLVPHTSDRDVSAPAPSIIKMESEQRTAPAAPASQVKVAPAAKEKSGVPGKTGEISAANKPVAQPVSNAPSMARDEILSNNGSLAKLQAAAHAANAVGMAKAMPMPPPPPPPAAAVAGNKLEASDAGAKVAAVPPEAKRNSTVADMGVRSGAVGGPVLKDAHGAVVAGTITDPSGAVVPNALVKITNAQSNTSTDVRTDSAGTYRTPVTPGVYSVEASSPGFEPAKTTNVNVAGVVAQNFTLHPGTATETVTVSSESQAVMAAPVSPPHQAERTMIGAGKGAGIAGGVSPALDRKYKAWLQPVWRVTRDGTLERSADGKTWTKPDSSPASALRAVAALGADVWAGGEGGTLYHSTDDGRTWTRVPVGAKGAPVSDAITSISLPKAKSVHIATSSGQQWTSNDAGATWALHAPR